MISAELRRTVRILYAFSCGYCGVTETEVGSQLTIDHYHPKDAGGADHLANLVYSCPLCNLHKSTAWSSQQSPILHPLQTEMNLHTRLRPDGILEALTPEGGLHIETLHLNRPPMVQRRKTKQLMEELIEQNLKRQEREIQAEQDIQRKRRLTRRRRFR